VFILQGGSSFDAQLNKSIVVLAIPPQTTPPTTNRPPTDHQPTQPNPTRSIHYIKLTDTTTGAGHIDLNRISGYLPGKIVVLLMNVGGWRRTGGATGGEGRGCWEEEGRKGGR
jgi:hypothetical protein